MNQFFDWLAMGGYSIYVWPAYGLVCAVLVMNLLWYQMAKETNSSKITTMV